MARLLDQLLPSLQSLEQKLGKTVILERIPILFGIPYMGIHSFTNGLLAHRANQGVYFVTTPATEDLSKYWLSKEEIEEALSVTKAVFSKYNTKVFAMNLPPFLSNALIGGLHCVTKVL